MVHTWVPSILGYPVPSDLGRRRGAGGKRPKPPPPSPAQVLEYLGDLCKGVQEGRSDAELLQYLIQEVGNDPMLDALCDDDGSLRRYVPAREDIFFGDREVRIRLWPIPAVWVSGF